MSDEESHLSRTSHTEDAEKTRRRVVLGVVRIIQRVQRPPRRLRQVSREGMSSPCGQALGQLHGKGKHVPTVWSHHQRQGRGHWDQQVDSTATDDRRDTASLQPNDGGRTEMDLVHDEIDEVKRSLEEAHLEVKQPRAK